MFCTKEMYILALMWYTIYCCIRASDKEKWWKGSFDIGKESEKKEALTIEAGMKPKTLQMLLGHSNIGITMNLYVHTTEEEKLKEIELVAEALKVM